MERERERREGRNNCEIEKWKIVTECNIFVMHKALEKWEKKTQQVFIDTLTLVGRMIDFGGYINIYRGTYAEKCMVYKKGIFYSVSLSPSPTPPTLFVILSRSSHVAQRFICISLVRLLLLPFFVSFSQFISFIRVLVFHLCFFCWCCYLFAGPSLTNTQLTFVRLWLRQSRSVCVCVCERARVCAVRAFVFVYIHIICYGLWI